MTPGVATLGDFVVALIVAFVVIIPMSLAWPHGIYGRLLSLARGSWTKRYNKDCLRLWRELHGDLIANRIEAIVKEKWNK